MTFRRALLAAALVLALVAPARSEEMDYPIAVVAAADGTVYVADRYLPGVWKVVDGKAEIYFRGSKKFRTPLNAIRCLALDREGRLLAGDSATRQIYRFDKPDQPQPLLKGPVGAGIPMALAVNRNGAIHIADLETQRIWRVPAAGGEPVEVAEIPGLRSLTIDGDDRLCALTNTSPAIVLISADGAVVPVLAARTFSSPQHLVLDKAGNALVSDGFGRAIWKVSPEGRAEKWVSGATFQHPVGIALSGERLLVTDSKERTVFVVSADKSVSRLAPGAVGK